MRIEGKEGISAKIIADSVSREGVRLTTLELEYPRFLHSELMTHRMLSKNCASSRAIPVDKMLNMIRETPAMPVYWGKNQPGMSAKEEVADIDNVKRQWIDMAKSCADISEKMCKAGLHKQITNRITEPWQRMKTVISGTEWINLFYLRDHPDAQPEFQELAKTIKLAMERSNLMSIAPGEWHVPYVKTDRNSVGTLLYFDSDNNELTLEEAIKISVSCAAQVSYRRLDESKEKSIAIYDRLIAMKPAHSSPCEHQGTPMGRIEGFKEWPIGVSHVDRSGKHWSGNFKRWIQYRKTIEGEAVW